MSRASDIVMARILIVDDHRISRQFMAAALRQNGANVKQAATASQALSIALAWLPDVVLLDVRLGDDCGYDIAVQLGRRWPAAVRKPDIVMLSAEAACSHPHHGTKPHRYPVLLKPVNLQQLLHAALPRTPTPPVIPEGQDAPSLRKLFRGELAEQLPLLEDALSERDLPGARAVLHRLIASSGLTGEPQLERQFRSMHEACDGKKTIAKLASEYYLLLTGVRSVMRPQALPEPA